MICNWSNTYCRIRKICTQLKYLRMSVLFYWSIIDNFGKVQMSTFFGCIFCLRVSLQHRPWCMSQSELALHSSPNWPDPGTGSWHMLSVHVYPTSQSVSYPHVSPDFFPHIGRHVPVTIEEIGTLATAQTLFVRYLPPWLISTQAVPSQQCSFLVQLLLWHGSLYAELWDIWGQKLTILAILGPINWPWS